MAGGRTVWGVGAKVSPGHAPKAGSVGWEQSSAHRVGGAGGDLLHDRLLPQCVWRSHSQRLTEPGKGGLQPQAATPEDSTSYTAIALHSAEQ